MHDAVEGLRHDPAPAVALPDGPPHHDVVDSHEFTVALALKERSKPSEVEKLVQPAVSSQNAF